MTDPRIKQLEKDIENEHQTSKSRYAFVGFGRSTDTATATEGVAKEGTKLMGGLLQVISAEKAYELALKEYKANPLNKTTQKALGYASQALSAAKNNFSNLQGLQKKRLKKLSEDIIGASRSQDLTQRYNHTFSRFKNRPEGRNFLKAKLISPTRTKVYKPGAERKENMIPQRKLSNILSSERKLGRTLSGIKK